MKLLMKKKIKITRDKYEKISKLYRFGGFAIIVGLLISFSSLIGKPVEFLCIFLPYFITKNFYAKQYHAKSLKNCFAYSLLIFGFAILTTLPKEISISFSILLGVLIAFISYKIGDIQFKLKDYKYISERYEKLLDFYKEKSTQKHFYVNNCTEAELIERCKCLHFSKENIELSIEFFINKTRHKIIADRLCIDEKSVTTRKKRLKEKLNNN